MFNLDLECLYAAAHIPTTVPLGPYYGDTLELINSGLLTPIGQAIWTGKIGTLLHCGSTTVRISWNAVGDRLRFPAILSIGAINVVLAPGEFDDGRGGFLIDYSQDFGAACPIGPDPSVDSLDVSLLNNPYPFNQILDVVRLVGRTPAGAAIYLGKTFLKSIFRPNNEAATIAFWAIRSYDTAADPQIHSGVALPPLGISFSYMHPGPVDVVFRSVPIPGLFLDPATTAARFLNYLDTIIPVFQRLLNSAASRGLTRLQQYLTSNGPLVQAAILVLLSQLGSSGAGIVWSESVRQASKDMPPLPSSEYAELFKALLTAPLTNGTDAAAAASIAKFVDTQQRAKPQPVTEEHWETVVLTNLALDETAEQRQR